MQSINTTMSNYSIKTADMNKLILHIHNYTSAPTSNGSTVYRELWNFYASKRFSLLKFDNFIHKRKSLDRFFMSLTSIGEKKPI